MAIWLLNKREQKNESKPNDEVFAIEYEMRAKNQLTTQLQKNVE